MLESLMAEALAAVCLRQIVRDQVEADSRVEAVTLTANSDGALDVLCIDGEGRPISGFSL
jgi:hypothetical protein